MPSLHETRRVDVWCAAASFSANRTLRDMRGDAVQVHVGFTSSLEGLLLRREDSLAMATNEIAPYYSGKLIAVFKPTSISFSRIILKVVLLLKVFAFK